MVVTREESGEEGALRFGRGRMQRRRLRGQIMAWIAALVPSFFMDAALVT